MNHNIKRLVFCKKTVFHHANYTNYKGSLFFGNIVSSKLFSTSTVCLNGDSKKRGAIRKLDLANLSPDQIRKRESSQSEVKLRNIQVQKYLERKEKRQRESSNKLAAILKLKSDVESTAPDQIKNVDDLKKLLPGMPLDQRARIQSTIEEYGDQLNEFLQETKDIASEGTLEEEQGGDLSSQELSLQSRNDTSIGQTEYASAIAILGQYVQEIIEYEETCEYDLSHKKGRRKLRDDLKEMYANLWKNVDLFSKMKADIEDPQDLLELLVALFQLAKNQPTKKEKTQAIRLVGDILYGLKMVRLDPYNESDYLDALAKHGETRKAIKIWESRLKKPDVKDSIWWQEVGMCLYQEINNLSHAEKLAQALLEKENYVPPKVVFRFMKKYIKIGRIDEAWRWCQFMMDQAKAHGGPALSDDFVMMTGNLEPQEAKQFFEQKTFPPTTYILGAVQLFSATLETEKTLKIIQEAQALGIQVPSNMILILLKSIARNVIVLEDKLASLVQPLYALPDSSTQSKTTSATATTTTEDKHPFEVLMESVSVRHPDLRKQKEFYQSWISGLLNLNKPDKVSSVIEQMSAEHVGTTPLIMYSLLKVLLSSSKSPHNAFAMLEAMKSGSSSSSTSSNGSNIQKYPKPQAMHYSLFIKHAAARNNHTMIKRVLHDMETDGMKMDESCVVALFYYYYRTKKFDDFFETFSQATTKHGITFSSEGYRVIWTVIRDYYRTFNNNNSNSTTTTKRNLDLRRLVLEMVTGVEFVKKPMLRSFEPAIQTMLVTGDYAAAFALLRYVSDNSSRFTLPPSFAFKLTTIAQRISRKQIRKLRFPLDSASYDKMIDSITCAGQPIEQSLKEMKKYSTSTATTTTNIENKKDQLSSTLSPFVTNLPGKNSIISTTKENQQLSIDPDIIIQSICQGLQIDFVQYSHETEQFYNRLVMK